MPRSFKIAFPLPRRPSASPNTTPGSNCDDSPLSHPGSKAERTLGASEPEISEFKKQQSKKQRKQMRKYPSFMSVTLSDVEGDSVQASDGFPFPGMQKPGETSGRHTRNLNRQGSSPLLGELHTTELRNDDNASFLSAPQARRADSTSTLRSHYDPAKLPLPVSQQTSASSVRDMALRKGFPPISSPLGFERIGGIKATDGIRSHSRSISNGSKASADVKLSGNSFKRIQGTPRRRPSVTDPPTLHPEQPRSFHAVSPPPALINSSLPKTLPPNTSQTKSRWWRRKPTSPKHSPPLSNESARNNEASDESFPPIKVNVTRPKAGIDGQRNWFDGIEDEDPRLKNPRHPETLQRPTTEVPKPPLSIYEIMSQEARPYQITQRKSSFNHKGQRNRTPDRKLSFRLDPSPQGSCNDSLVPNRIPRSVPNSPEAKSIISTTSNKGVPPGMDLQTESFLELSSSEDEGGDSSAPSEAQEPFRRHRIRASIEQVSYNNEVSISNAQHAQPVKPHSVVNRTPSRPLSKTSTSSEVPPVPRIPDKPKLNPRTSSTKWREIMDEKAGSTESTVDSGASSLTDNGNSRKSHSARSKRKPSVRGSRLMKVSSEEERLLEAMRDKRASIRQDDFEKGFRSAMQLQDIVSRPKTSGADGRGSRSSFYGSRSSSSPVPQEPSPKNMIGSRLSVSADDLLLDDAYPFPNVPSKKGVSAEGWKPPNLKSPMGFVSPSKPSPSLSFGTSEMLSSTPTSRDSPLTPPPGHNGLSIHGRGSKLSPPRGYNITSKFGHDRKRTGSSSVVMLDGLEHQAQEIGGENELQEYMAQW